MKIFKIILLILLIVFVGIQFISTNRNQSNSVPKTDFMTVYKLPKNINYLIQTSCYDCHSNNTVYPWYNRIQPVSWFMADHISEGKKKLNFNDFGTYSNRRQSSKLKEMIKEINLGGMPLTSYTIIHRNAILTNENKALLIDWLTKTKDSLSKIN